MEEICLGCGAVIQTTDKNKKGYIDPEVYKRKKKEDFYCLRCFTLRNYNKNIEYDFDSKEYLDNLDIIKKDKGLIVHIVDLFDLNGTLLKDINTIFDSKNILIVFNKADLFLNSINFNKVEIYLRTLLKEKGIKYLDIILMSSFKLNDIDNLLEKINEYKNKKNVYFVGMTNVGKSSILNKIIKNMANQDNLITVSNTMNTTTNNIYIPYDEKTFFVDTPGIINKKHLMYYIDKTTLEAITPKSFIRPRTFQLNPGQTIFVMGFVRIDFILGEKSSFVTNFDNNVLVHRTKLENADDFYQDHLDDILKYPNASERERLGELKKMRIDFNLSEKIDIVISGLGFISIYGKGAINIKTFANIEITKRKAMY